TFGDRIAFEECRECHPLTPKTLQPDAWGLSPYREIPVSELKMMGSGRGFYDIGPDEVHIDNRGGDAYPFGYVYLDGTRGQFSRGWVYPKFSEWVPPEPTPRLEHLRLALAELHRAGIPGY